MTDPAAINVGVEYAKKIMAGVDTFNRYWPRTVWELEIFVPGKPAAQGSKRHVGNGRLIEQSKAVGPWRERVAYSAAQQRGGEIIARDVPLRVLLNFVMPRPASCPKRSTPPAVKRPDTDKMIRAVFDALSGVTWTDDSQVVQVSASKRLAAVDETPGCHIRVGRADA